MDASAPSPVKWAGDWGNGFSRECTHRDGLSEPMTIDSYIMQRACMFVDADVYVPGLTDVSGDPSLLLAQVVASVDGGDEAVSWLSYEGRVNNNFRYRWTVDRQALSYADWSEVSYTFRFSTDGVDWYDIGHDDGTPRTLVRGY